MATGLPVVLVTANVGSIFEEPSVMLKGWTEEFLSTISRLDPKFIALHCQEVGGKNYGQSMRHVADFVRLLMSSEELRLFDKVRVFLDEDFSSAEHFTALGNFYFIHNTVKDVMLWDFKECTFTPVIEKEVYSGNIEAVTTKEKAKFPQDFFPECRWSRKGFLRTRWDISGTVFDLINIHLFHDASNLVAMETFPSVYSKTRRRALEHTLDKFHNDQYTNVPYFLFGDFNFRTDTSAVIQKLTEDTHEDKLSSKGIVNKVQYRNKKDNLVLTLGKKEFSHYEHQHVFNEGSGQWLREYDKELKDFEGRLFEFPIQFGPSYPYQEDIKEGTNYMQTRVPAWCDRVLLSPSAKTLVEQGTAPNSIEYGIIGQTTCMGDHKPVYLKVLLALDAGMINCCSLPNAPEFCFQVSDMELLSMLPDYRSCASARVLSVDLSSNLLHAVPAKHDPYTPDSMDSPSPNTLAAAGESSDFDADNSNGASEPSSSLVQIEKPATSERKRVDRAVSPALLKSRLEIIVRNNKQVESLEVSRTECAEIRRSPSENHLSTWSNSDLDQVEMRQNRSNSDISWKKQQANKNWTHTSRSCNSELQQPFTNENLVIPKIAIINASNYVSDSSSIHLHDERLSICSEQCSSAYSESRTKTISRDGLSQVKSEEFCNRIAEEGEKVANALVEVKAPEICGEPKTYCEQAVCDSNVIDIFSRSEIEVLRTESKPELASKNTTRSNSIQSQDRENNAGVTLKLKAYNKVTERCKKNIAGKGRCRKCCVVS